jgi:hypothetical protein
MCVLAVPPRTFSCVDIQASNAPRAFPQFDATQRWPENQRTWRTHFDPIVMLHSSTNAAKGSKVGVHLRIDRRYGGFKSVDLIEMKAPREAVALTCRSARLATLAGLVSLATFRRKISSTNPAISRPQTPRSCTTVRIHPRSA